MARILCIIAIIFPLLLSQDIVLATNINNNVSAIVAGDADSGEIVIEYEANKPVPIASTTKIMTYLVIRDLIKDGKGGLDEPITIGPVAAETEGSSFKLKEGEIVSTKDLLESIMIVSANDSCIALAAHYGDTLEGFVDLMNSKAKELNLESAKFYTVNGLPDSEGNENIMTARELFKLSSHLVEKYPDVLEITKKPELNALEREYSEPNSNTLLKDIEGLDGLKTGYTDKAGRCLVATGKKSPDSFRAMSIVMGANSVEARDEKSFFIIKDLYDNYEKKIICKKNGVLGNRLINGSRFMSIDIVPKEDIYVITKGSEDYDTEIVMFKQIGIPIKAGDTVGKMIVKHGDNRREVDLTVKNDIGRISSVGIWIKGFINSFKSNK